VRLCAFRDPGGAPAAQPRIGLVLGTGSQTTIHPFPGGTSMTALLADSEDARDAAADEAAGADGHPLRDVQLLPPVYPVAMRDL